MGTSGSGGTLRVYDTATEQFIHESFGYGDFTAFGSNVIIPEPGTMVLASFGLLGLLRRRR